MRMRVANESQLNIQGAIIMRLTNPRTDKTTRQMVYVTPDVTKLYISREACADLGIIEPSFPNAAAAAISDTGGTPKITPTQGIARTETHHTQSPFHQARSVPLRTKKTIFDAWNRYHSVALHEADRHFTTFITPWGRYRYRTAPQGYIASGDGYTSRYDGIVAHIQDKTKCTCFGHKPWRRLTNKQQNGSTHAATMGSHSTLPNSDSPETRYGI